MRVWVDADACPVAIREILFRAAERTRVQVTLVANEPPWTPRSRWIDSVRVAPGFDVADDEIISRMAPGDLVVTGDIPLAAAVVERGGYALSPRGELHSAETVRQRLNMRDFMDTMRASGMATGGPPPLGKRERSAFAGHLDRLLARRAQRR